MEGLLLWSIYFCLSFEYGFIIFSILLVQDLHCSVCYISNTVSSVICDYYTYAILPSFILFSTVGCICDFFCFAVFYYWVHERIVRVQLHWLRVGLPFMRELSRRT